MIDVLRMVRKLRKGSHGYLTFQIPQEITDQLKLKAGDKVIVELTENGGIMLEIKDNTKNKRVVGTDGRNVQVTNLSRSDELVTS